MVQGGTASIFAFPKVARIGGTNVMPRHASGTCTLLLDMFVCEEATCEAVGSESCWPHWEGDGAPACALCGKVRKTLESASSLVLRNN
jgi:hypothetical protein